MVFCTVRRTGKRKHSVHGLQIPSNHLPSTEYDGPPMRQIDSHVHFGVQEKDTESLMHFSGSSGNELYTP